MDTPNTSSGIWATSIMCECGAFLKFNGGTQKYYCPRCGRERSKGAAAALTKPAPLPSTLLECMECGHFFRKRLGHNTDIQCPKCGGYDIDLA